MISPLTEILDASSEQSPPITQDEVAAVVRKLKCGRACGDDQLLAEMHKTSHEGLLEDIAHIFTDILRGGCEIPDAWRISRLVVLFKKGDTTLPKNYRPIAIISVFEQALQW